MDFSLPTHLTDLLGELDRFIEAEIEPLQQQDDNMRFFDHRREFARTDVEAGGTPTRDWEELLGEARRRADAAGFFRYSLPEELGGRNGSNLDMAVIREHLAHRGLGLHNDLQNEHSIVGNVVFGQLLHLFGTPEQKAEFVEPLITGERGLAFGLTEPDHGSDATWMETTAVRRDGDWVIDGRKRWNTGVHTATHDVVFARTSGEPGAARGITAFIVPTDSPGFSVPFYWWTLNMPSDHGEVELDGVRVPDSAILRARGWPWPRRSCTRTGSGRPPPAWARRSTASTSRSGTPGSGSPSASRWPNGRRSSSRWSSCTRRRSCSAR